ncbi:PP2C family protein-serine/threonine phosphatase [Allorhizocola rhizosphaerae]|uniref:PP2C family protein-serine/threonine phosphatase n=1 Tax=Allorhizocola rhizosphaerae TaxID=1872709 RepID=UPI000E3DA419|nr:PP2C family protein-serine/threonine phosphatase [Allorhizocola rhizosphaerae]
MADHDRLWDRAMTDFLSRAQFALPEELADVANTALAPLRARMTVYLVDHEQRELHPLPHTGQPPHQSLPVDGTLAGRAFSAIQSVKTVETGHASGADRWWLPLLDDTERLGVVELIAGDDGDTLHRAGLFASLLAHLLATKFPYGDALHRGRRTRNMSASGELLLAMLPPLTFSCPSLVVSAILEPAYDVGGDGFDYAVQSGLARFTVIDAMGRGLQAAITSVTAMSAMRAARRNGLPLAEVAAAGDAALVESFGDMRFATGVLAELDIDTGLLRYVNAGHPPPVLMRRHHAVTELDDARRLPLGLGTGPAEYAETSLEPGDRVLLYTDGVVEARDIQGDQFGVPRLIDMAERGAAAQLPAPETLRRLSHAVLEHQGGPPADDATMMLVEWAP